MIFVCPICKGALKVGDSGNALCDNSHSFDRSREGYYNLLLPSRGGVHGDCREMVEARRSFLSMGYYQPLADLVADSVASLARDGDSILDLGCGEGYYTDRVFRTLAERGVCASVAGFDISKDAVRRAAKRNRELQLAVAGSYHIPALDGSVDIAINTFSPLALDETRRILRTGASFVMAIPAENHLFSLKRALYREPYRNTVLSDELEGFTLSEKIPLSYEISLDSREAVSSLFLMTPYAYRTSLRAAQKLESINTVDITAQFILRIFQK